MLGPLKEWGLHISPSKDLNNTRLDDIIYNIIRDDKYQT